MEKQKLCGFSLSENCEVGKKGGKFVLVRLYDKMLTEVSCMRNPTTTSSFFAH